jgi:hypothetical protein
MYSWGKFVDLLVFKLVCLIASWLVGWFVFFLARLVVTLFANFCIFYLFDAYYLHWYGTAWHGMAWQILQVRHGTGLGYPRLRQRGEVQGLL